MRGRKCKRLRSAEPEFHHNVYVVLLSKAALTDRSILRHNPKRDLSKPAVYVGMTGLPVVHIYQSRLFPGAIGAWSCHAKSVDRLFVNQGHVKVVLYDGREDSPTHGQLMELHVGDARPTFLVVPIGVWHGLQNLGATDALMLNFPTHAYDYEDPDHYRLPWDTPEIPYTWTPNGMSRLRSDRTSS